MTNGPLDYASPHGARIKGAPTPEQIRFRRRLRYALLIAFILGLIPYPTQVLPSIKLQLIDPSGKPVTAVVSLHWEGFNNHETLDGHVQFDLSAQASIPRQQIWSTPFGRIANYLSSLLPHSGGFPSIAFSRLYFYVPPDYSLDAQTMGLNQDRYERDAWIIPQTGDRISFAKADVNRTDQAVHWEIQKPGNWGASDYKLKIILQKAPTSTTIPSLGNKPK